MITTEEVFHQFLRHDEDGLALGAGNHYVETVGIEDELQLFMDVCGGGCRERDEDVFYILSLEALYGVDERCVFIIAHKRTNQLNLTTIGSNDGVVARFDTIHIQHHGNLSHEICIVDV